MIMARTERKLRDAVKDLEAAKAGSSTMRDASASAAQRDPGTMRCRASRSGGANLAGEGEGHSRCLASGRLAAVGSNPLTTSCGSDALATAECGSSACSCRRRSGLGRAITSKIGRLLIGAQLTISLVAPPREMENPPREMAPPGDWPSLGNRQPTRID